MHFRTRTARQASALEQVAHRPWPLPTGRWLMGQSWEDLLFAHWPVDPAALARVMPPQIQPDVFAGSAWLGITPFRVRALRLRGLPPLGAGSRFAELNVRTYATLGGRPGIYFFSLDAASRFAVAAARRVYRLPYFHARMAVARHGAELAYSSRRVSADGPRAELAIRYRPVGAAFTARPGTLEHFLTERYCAYTLDERRRVLRAEIHHRPWPLQPAIADIDRNTMAEPLAVTLADPPALLHFAARQDVVIWPHAIV